LIFPSWVMHSVEGNKSDKPRISMSFNTIPVQNDQDGIEW